MRSHVCPTVESSNPPSAPRVARRAVVLGSAMSIGVTVGVPGKNLSSAAATTPRSPSIEVATSGASGVTLVAASGEASIQPSALGASLVNRGAPLPKGSLVSIAFDPSLYGAGSVATLTINDAVHSVARQLRHVSDTQAVVSLYLPAQVDTGAVLSLSIGSLRPGITDGVINGDLPGETVVSLNDKSGQHASLVLSDALPADKSWSVRTGGGSVERILENGVTVAVLSSVTLRSVGMSAMPAGSSIRILVDQTLFADLDISQAVDSAGEVIRGAVSFVAPGSVVWTSAQGLEPGDWLTLEVTSTVVSPVSHELELLPTTVFFVGGESGLGSFQQATGAESFSLPCVSTSAATA